MPELDVPAERLVLLPVRIETRFRDLDEKPHLWIRLYPDAVHGERHQPELTLEEQEAGEKFLEYWDAADDQRSPAWDALARRFGPRRAAWIVHVLRNPPQQRREAAAGVTRVLPERWVALGYRGDRRLFAHWAENPVEPELRIGPALNAEPDPAATVDTGIRWLVDFGEARAAGMAMQVPLPDRDGVDVLIVLGVKGTIDATQSRRLLEELLEGHHYTDGLAFVPEGTPTNNTPDARSGFRSRDPGSETSYGVELNDQLKSEEGAPYGYLAAGALGVDATIFRHVQHAGAGRGMNAARGDMNAVLWPATGGYFLSQMMAPTFSNDAVRRGRDHFVRHVRASGLPVIRIDEQPYGVLPTVKLDSVKDPDLPQLPGFLHKLVGIWRDSLKDVPRVGDARSGSNVGKDLLAALSVQPRSLTYRGRDVLGKQYVGALWRFLQQPVDDEWWDKGQRALLRALKSRLNVAWTPRIEDSVVAENYFEWPNGRPIVHDPEVPWSEQNYLANWFGRQPTPDYRSLRDDDGGGPSAERPLLRVLLRHSLLLAYVSSAARMLDGPNAPPPREEEVVEVDPDEYGDVWPLLPWDLLDRRLADGTPVGRRLDEQDIEDVGPVRTSIRELASQPPETLEQLLAETLDLCSHRLDAWITAFARKRLDAARAQGKGILLGAYGWVEDLRPSDSSANGSGTFVQAPSVTHANAAAILASGYLSRREGANAQTLAVDLSSDRVRAALWLLEGIGQGQSLGALLGYRFERALQERQVADLIDDFRSHFPIKETRVEHEPSGPNTVVATNVVDGLSLQRAWSKTDRSGSVFGTAGWPHVNGNDARRPAVVEALNALDDAVDAVSDAILAESVYQMAQGNPARAGATLDSMTNAEALPAELEVAQTPRSGVALTHRVLALLPAADPEQPRGGEDVEPTLIRAQAEPRLSAWAASLLGELKNVVCLVEYCDPETGEPLEPTPRKLTLAQVQPEISQLDVVYDSAGGEGGSVLEQRIVYHAVRTRPEGMRPDARIRLTLQAENGGNEKTIGLAEVMEVARALRELLAGARPLDPRDLSRPEAPAHATNDSEELGERATLARGSLDKTRAGLAAAVNGEDLEGIRRELLRAAAFGAPGSIPLSATGVAIGDAGILIAQGKAVADELDRRIKAADAESDVLEQLEAIFGASFRVLPRMTLTSPDAEETLDVAFATSAALQGAPTAATEWAQRVSRVRAGVARLADVLTYGEVVHGTWAELEVGQLPKEAPRWSALPFPPDSEPPGGLSYVAHLPLGAVDPTRPLAGLLVDEWVEVIPSATETTAVALNYDRPSSTAPNAILVAVPPEDDLERWDLDTLAETVRQTFDLARIRAVDRDALREVGHFLPASYLALNLLGATVASDLRHGTGIPLTVRQ